MKNKFRHLTEEQNVMNYLNGYKKTKGGLMNTWYLENIPSCI